MAKKRVSRSAARSYSMPEMSGLYGPPPFEYRDARQLLVIFQTDPRVLRKLVPSPLTPDKDGTMFIAMTEFFTSGMGGYNEMIIAGIASIKRRPVNYALYLVLDNDIAICGGREIWGFPKKYGRVELNEQDGVMTGTAERGGIRLVELTVSLAEFGAPEEITGGSYEYVCRKFMPSVSLDLPPEVDQLTSTTLTNTEVRNVHKGPATLRFGLSAADRMQDIPVRNVTGGYFYSTDFTLGDGEVIHDYLS
jgi:acetoacetate decarboxylase